MSNCLVVLFLLFLIQVNISNGAPNNNKCNTFQARADRYLKKMLFIGEDPKLPRNDSAVVDYCKQVRKGLTMVKRYQTCLRPFPQQILGLVLRGAKQSTNHVCDEKSRRQDVLKYLSCLEGKRLDKAYAMMRRAMNVIEYIAYNVTDDKQLFPHICCSYHFVSERIHRFIQRECPDKSAEAEKFLTEIVSIAFKEIIDLGCSKSASLKVCEEKHPSVLKAVKDARFSRNGRLEDKSFVKPILAIADRLAPPDERRRNQ